MRKVVLLAALIAVACDRSGGGGSAKETERGGRRVGVPSSITSDCSRSVDDELAAFLGSVPNGSTVAFPVQGCYGHDRPILLADRTNLTIDGQGSTFQKRSPSEPAHPNNASWRVAGGDRVTLQNMRITGGYAAPPRGSAGQGQTTDHGISVWGGSHVSVLDVQVLDVDGECLAVDPDVRRGTDYRLDPPSRDVIIERVRCAHAARQGVSATAVDGFTLSSSSIEDVQQVGVDIEIDVAGEVARNVRILDNTFSGSYTSAVSVPAGNWPDVGNVVIRGNRMTEPPDTCYPPIVIGGNGSRINEVEVTGNILLTLGDGIQIDSVQTGRVTDNEVRKSPGNACFRADRSPAASVPVRLLGSGVVETNNRGVGFDS